MRPTRTTASEVADLPNPKLATQRPRHMLRSSRARLRRMGGRMTKRIRCGVWGGLDEQTTERAGRTGVGYPSLNTTCGRCPTYARSTIIRRSLGVYHPSTIKSLDPYRIVAGLSQMCETRQISGFLGQINYTVFFANYNLFWTFLLDK